MKEIELEVHCFNLKYTLECGQCFRWKCVDENKCEYIGVIKDRVIKIRQERERIFITSNREDNLENVVLQYFDLLEDYQMIEERIKKVDKNVEMAVKKTSGIRHLNQGFFETVVSYIISANNNIPRITKSVEEISRRYGEKVYFEDKEYYLFPTMKQLEKVTAKEFRECGVGFRDAYLESTVKDLLLDKITKKDIEECTTEELKKKLLSLKGIGPKVADCILLFACNKRDVFPIDVWVERVMSILYFSTYHGNIKKKEILQYANEHFGMDAGIIQQHLFYNMREKMLS